MIVIPSHEHVVDFEDKPGKYAFLAAGETRKTVVSIVTKNGYRAFISFVGQAWDPAIDGDVTWRVTKDGAAIYQLQDSTIQKAAPEQPQNELSPWLEVPQGCTVTLEGDLASTAAGTGNIYGRLKIYYVPINPYQGDL